VHAGAMASELKELGKTSTQLRDADFTAAELRSARFTINEIKTAGFSASDMKQAGFTVAELWQVGYKVAELKAANFTIEELRRADLTLNDLKAAFAPRELKRSGFTLTQLANEFSAKELKEQADASAQEFRNAGVALSQLQGANFTLTELLRAGYSIKELHEANALRLTEPRHRVVLNDQRVSLQALLDGGFTPQELASAYNVFELKAMGVGAGDMFNRYGVPIKDIVAARFKPAELQVLTDNMSREQLRDSFDLQDFKDLKYTIQQLLDLGHTMDEIRHATRRAGGWLWLEVEIKRQGHTAPWICQATTGVHNWGSFWNPAEDSTKCYSCGLKIADGLQKRH